jgi:cytochrome P450
MAVLSQGDLMSTAVIQDFDDPKFNPFIVSEVTAGQGQVADIYPELRRLRHISPAHEMDPRTHFGTMPDGTLQQYRKWVILGHPAVNRILTNAEEFSNKNYLRNLGIMFGRSITTMDPPEHRRYRALFQQAFLPNMLAKWKDSTIPGIIDGLIDKFIERGRAELISEFALHFPFLFVMELLELPEHSRRIFHKLAFCQTVVRYDPEHAKEAIRKLTAYVETMIATRRENPVSDRDFVHVITQAQIDGEYLPHDVIVGFFRQLMNAAGDTSYHGFSSVIGTLLRHPEQFEAVRKDRGLVAQTIEEGLRLEPPIVYVERMPARQVVIGDKTIEAGDHLFVSIGDANHDESVFENPDKFDIFRPKQRILSFGGGMHVCIGQHLARMELTIALNRLLDRLPNLRLDPDYPPPLVHGVTMRKPKAAYVRWG